MLRERIRGDFRDDLGQDADSEPGGAGVGLLCSSQSKDNFRMRNEGPKQYIQ